LPYPSASLSNWARSLHHRARIRPDPCAAHQLEPRNFLQHTTFPPRNSASESCLEPGMNIAPQTAAMRTCKVEQVTCAGSALSAASKLHRRP
jgi:hypothetical protein